MRRDTRTAEEKLRASSRRDQSTGCLLWTGASGGGGYGHVRWQGRPINAHRLAYATHVGPIPAGLFVCHRCDTPRCIEPSHLFLGTAADNNRDRMKKGRGAAGARSGAVLHPDRVPRGERHGSRTKPERVPRGERVGSARLTEAQVRELHRRRRDEGVSERQLAAAFGIHPSHVHHILTGRKWAHVFASLAPPPGSVPDRVRGKRRSA